MLAAILVHVGQAAPVHLRLLLGSRLEANGGLSLTATTLGQNAGLQDGIPAVIPQGLQFPVQHHTVFQPSDILQSIYSVYESSFDARFVRALDRNASGDLRYRRTVFLAMPRSSATLRMERPAPFISQIFFTCPTINKV